MNTQDEKLMNALDECREVFSGLARRIGDKLKDKYSPREYGLLVVIRRLGRAKLKDIAEMVFGAKPLICMRLGMLERRGLVARERDENDRRNVFYVLAPAGTKMIDEVKDVIRGNLSEMLSPLSEADKAELKNSAAAAARILGKV